MSTVDTPIDEPQDTGLGREPLAEMSLIEHLTELRHRLFVSVGALLLGTIVSWFFSQQIYDVLSLPVTRVLEANAQTPEDARLAVLSLTEAFISVWIRLRASARISAMLVMVRVAA